MKITEQTRKDQARRRLLGASLVEFALVVPLLLIFMAFILDAFYVAHMYSRLTFETAEITRFVASVTGRGSLTRDCAQLETLASDAIDNFTGRSPLSKGMTFTATVRGGDLLGVPNYRVLSIRGAWKLTCSTCRFFSKGKELSNESTLIVESSSTGCS